MSTKRRKWVLATGILIAATGAGPVMAENFDGSMATMNRVPGREVGQQPANPGPQQVPAAQIEMYSDGQSAVMLPPPPAADGPKPQAAPATLSAPVLNMAAPPAPAKDCKSCAPTDYRNCESARRQRKHNCQEKFLGYPDQFWAQPLGQSVYDTFGVMVANGDAARMILYEYDFVEGSEALNFRGKDQLAKLVALLASNPAPLVIERIPTNPRLAEARRLAVLNELAASPIPVSPDRVVVGATAIGLRGVEAGLIYENLLSQTQSMGRTGGSGGASGSQGQGSSQSGQSGSQPPSIR